MPHMIPNSVSSDTRSEAEKKLFMRMTELEGADDWYVLHSVGIANHPTQSQGEADFVVIMPGEGVFTLEVKGGEISYDGNHWRSKDYYGHTHKIHDPVAEANNASHAFKSYLGESLPWAANLMYGFGVVFLDCELHGKVTFPDLDDDQICDVTDLEDVRSFMIGLATHWKRAFAKTGFKPAVPDVEQCAQIAQLLRPTFETTVSASAEIKNLESDIVKLTERQMTVFEGLMENDRVLVKGGAGTGKTLMALRYAQGMAEDGRRVGLFCFSPRLAEFFKRTVKDMGSCAERIHADSFPEYMNRTVLPHFWTEDLEQFDVLVLDEAQELITASYTDALSRILKGGLKEGIWCMFADADPDRLGRLHQSAAGIDRQLKDAGIYFTRFTLKENCRNSMAIIDTVDELFGMNDQPIAREEYGQEVQFAAYGTKEEQAAHLKKQIAELLADGVKPQDIVVLSPDGLQESAAGKLDNVYGSWKEAREHGGVMFSTIEEFRSMESPVVIIADCGKASLSTDARSMYIAMTRARGMLIVNLDREAKEYLDENRGKGFLQRYGG